MDDRQLAPEMSEAAAAAFKEICPALIAELKEKLRSAPFFGTITIEAHFESSRCTHSRVITEKITRGPSKGSAVNGQNARRNGFEREQQRQG
jgi:hypothetical protein